jgi:exonuclease III
MAFRHDTRIRILDDFLRKQDIDILFLQEVTHAKIETIGRYNAHLNIGTDSRGTAILAKERITLSNIQRLPWGRTIAATLNGIRLVNIYAPSGSQKRREREAFFNEGVVPMLPPARMEMIIAGDFNCVIATDDTTGHNNYSKALARLIQGLELRDSWDATSKWKAYTHHTTKGASRIDRIYLTDNPRRTLQGAEAVAAAFTDHMAIIIRLPLLIPGIARGKGYWRMSVSYMCDPPFRHTL